MTLAMDKAQTINNKIQQGETTMRDDMDIVAIVAASILFVTVIASIALLLTIIANTLGA